MDLRKQFHIEVLKLILPKDHHAAPDEWIMNGHAQITI